MHYDVVVLGLGAMGSAALAHLARRRTQVLGLERFHPAHALGSSHGGSRVIRQAYFEDPAYVPLVLRAYELWADLERRTGRHLFMQTGGLMAGFAGSEVVEGALRSAQMHGLAHELLESDQIRRRFPATRPLADEVAVYEPYAGILFPEEAVLAHLQEAVAAGAEARFGAAVTDWCATPGGHVRIGTSDGEIEAESLVITAGAWFGAVAPELGVALRVERNVMHWFAPTADHLGPESLPVYLLQRRDEPVLYGFAALPGQGLKAAFHHSEQYTAPDTVVREVALAEVEAVRTALAGWLPGAAGACMRSAVCMYTNTRDEHFIIGQHPAYPQVVLAGGFSGHGFKFCPVVGEIVADLVGQGATAHPISLFSPHRFG